MAKQWSLNLPQAMFGVLWALWYAEFVKVVYQADVQLPFVTSTTAKVVFTLASMMWLLLVLILWSRIDRSLAQFRLILDKQESGRDLLAQLFWVFMGMGVHVAFVLSFPAVVVMVIGGGVFSEHILLFGALLLLTSVGAQLLVHWFGYE